jgi:hypothetical protein
VAEVAAIVDLAEALVGIDVVFLVKIVEVELLRKVF